MYCWFQCLNITRHTDTYHHRLTESQRKEPEEAEDRGLQTGSFCLSVTNTRERRGHTRQALPSSTDIQLDLMTDNKMGRRSFKEEEYETGMNSIIQLLNQFYFNLGF